MKHHSGTCRVHTSHPHPCTHLCVLWTFLPARPGPLSSEDTRALAPTFLAPSFPQLSLPSPQTLSLPVCGGLSPAECSELWHHCKRPSPGPGFPLVCCSPSLLPSWPSGGVTVVMVAILLAPCSPNLLWPSAISWWQRPDPSQSSPDGTVGNIRHRWSPLLLEPPSLRFLALTALGSCYFSDGVKAAVPEGAVPLPTP